MPASVTGVLWSCGAVKILLCHLVLPSVQKWTVLRGLMVLSEAVGSVRNAVWLQRPRLERGPKATPHSEGRSSPRPPSSQGTGPDFEPFLLAPHVRSIKYKLFQCLMFSMLQTPLVELWLL